MRTGAHSPHNLGEGRLRVLHWRFLIGGFMCCIVLVGFALSLVEGAFKEIFNQMEIKKRKFTLLLTQPRCDELHMQTDCKAEAQCSVGGGPVRRETPAGVCTRCASNGHTQTDGPLCVALEHPPPFKDSWPPVVQPRLSSSSLLSIQTHTPFSLALSAIDLSPTSSPPFFPRLASR